jgi:hypothetical protein
MTLIPDHDATVRRESADAVCMAPPYIAAVAFTRLIDLVAGECSRPETIMSFGEPAARERWAG